MTILVNVTISIGKLAITMQVKETVRKGKNKLNNF